jgi:hypothetical protein
MHLGIQITAIRAGVPEKYSREITDRYWAELEGKLPRLEDFSDVFTPSVPWVEQLQCQSERVS